MTQDFSHIYKAADAAGRAAAEVRTPTPMVIGQAKDLFSRELDRSQPYYIEYGGPCGFAWVSFKGNTAWGRWAKKNNIARSHYPSGLCVWVSDFNQSVELKEAYAEAFAKVLQEAGIEACAGSRLD